MDAAARVRSSKLSRWRRATASNVSPIIRRWTSISKPSDGFVASTKSRTVSNSPTRAIFGLVRPRRVVLFLSLVSTLSKAKMLLQTSCSKVPGASAGMMSKSRSSAARTSSVAPSAAAFLAMIFSFLGSSDLATSSNARRSRSVGIIRPPSMKSQGFNFEKSESANRRPSLRFSTYFRPNNRSISPCASFTQVGRPWLH